MKVVLDTNVPLSVRGDRVSRRMWHVVSVVSLALLVYWGTSAADWYVTGAQYSCSTKAGTFTLLPRDKSSDNEDPPLEPGFEALPDGVSNLTCRLGKRKLEAQIGVTPPQARGMCMGAGAVDVTSLAVNGVELLDRSLQFNWSCAGGDEPVVSMRVRTRGSLVDLEKCTVKVTTADNAKAKPICSTKSFDVDAIAAANTQLDHQLADRRTQDLQSATRLPPENDLAQVFASSVPAGSDVPLCAHWSAVFLNAITAPERQRHGRIAGKDGERVYIRPANPQLCVRADDDGCTGRAYLLPGDRVDVGFLCGTWTQIQYQRRIRTKRPIKGWVETARLYAVDSVAIAMPPSSLALLAKQPPIPADSLLRTVATGNLEELKRLVAAGASPDGANTFGDPLVAAVESGNLDAVQELLRLGANVNAQHSDRYRKCRILALGVESESILDVLVKAGIDLNCRGGQFGSTLLMFMAGYNRLWAWERIHGSAGHSSERLRDPLLLAKRLLAAGADPNARDNWGKTALFYTMQPNNVDVGQLLLDSGADPNISIDSQGEGASPAQQTGSTPLMEAFHWYSLTWDSTLFQMLLAHGADPNYRDQSRYNKEWDETTSGAVTFAGQTALTRAAQDGYFSLARMLLEAGADPTIPREDGALAETLAQDNNHSKIAALIKHYTERRKTDK